MQIKVVATDIAVLLSANAYACASTTGAYAALDKASVKACITASGFLNAKISAATRFSDETGYDARTVSGTYPQKHMKGAKGQMLCLYNRKTKQVEVQELVK